MVRRIPVGAIVAGDNGTGHQDRTHFDADSLAELAADIDRNGLACPPLVRPIAGGRYELIAGERRVRAMRDVLGWSDIPCLVRDLSDAAARALMWSENDRRADLKLSEQARAIAARRRPGQSVAELAADLGRQVRWAENRLALLELDAPVLALVDSGQLRLERAVMVAALPHAAQRAAVARAGDASADVWRQVVSELLAAAQQSSMFDAGAYELTQEEWDTAAGAYVTAATNAERAAELDDELYGVQELAKATRRTVAAIHQARSRMKLPQPDLTISGTPIWRRGTLRAAGILKEEKSQ
jgi:ParB family chromosome partitioning protein